MGATSANAAHEVECEAGCTSPVPVVLNTAISMSALKTAGCPDVPLRLFLSKSSFKDKDLAVIAKIVSDDPEKSDIADATVKFDDVGAGESKTQFMILSNQLKNNGKEKLADLGAGFRLVCKSKIVPEESAPPTKCAVRCGSDEVSYTIADQSTKNTGARLGSTTSLRQTKAILDALKRTDDKRTLSLDAFEGCEAKGQEIFFGGGPGGLITLPYFVNIQKSGEDKKKTLASMPLYKGRDVLLSKGGVTVACSKNPEETLNKLLGPLSPEPEAADPAAAGNDRVHSGKVTSWTIPELDRPASGDAGAAK